MVLYRESTMAGVLVRVSIAVKRHHEHGNSSKKNIQLRWLLTVSEFQSIIIMVGSRAVCRQTWCCLHLDQKATGSGL